MRTMEFTMSRPGLVEPGQEVEITSASVGFVNERQKVEISLQKLLEQDETFSIGMNEEWKNITFQKRHCKRGRRNQPWILRTGGI